MMGLDDAVAAVKRLKALAKAEILESEAFGLNEQQIAFAKERHHYYSRLLDRLETEPLDDLVEDVQKQASELWHRETKNITEKADLVAAESFLRAIGLEPDYDKA
ncbi:hypothetical protein [Coprothermobacter platensis]|jgi:hypothetical protein|uniref:hypothetical protein n=1 Tax=Coprothermobacter platensis TaxID=108819 RepID=UPI000362A132|nr:hypothetical protein [Coprothermobacter platensis]